MKNPSCPDVPPHQRSQEVKEASPDKNVPEVTNAPKGGIGDKVNEECCSLMKWKGVSIIKKARDWDAARYQGSAGRRGGRKGRERDSNSCRLHMLFCSITISIPRLQI